MRPTPCCLLSLLGNSFASFHPIFESLKIIEEHASMDSPSRSISIRITVGHDMLVHYDTC